MGLWKEIKKEEVLLDNNIGFVVGNRRKSDILEISNV